MKTAQIAVTPIIPGLLAEGPDPKLKDKLLLFGRFVGSWQITAKYYLPDGSTREGKGEVHYGWASNGRAIQDVWITYKENSLKEIEKISVGTTLRFFEPSLNAWRCVWVSPVIPIIQTFVAREIGDEIVLEAQNQEDRPEKWIYSQITPQSFHWRAIEKGGGSDWRLTEEMWIRRAT